MDTCPLQRFTLRRDPQSGQLQIRANFGHSMKVGFPKVSGTPSSIYSSWWCYVHTHTFDGIWLLNTYWFFVERVRYKSTEKNLRNPVEIQTQDLLNTSLYHTLNTWTTGRKAEDKVNKQHAMPRGLSQISTDSYTLSVWIQMMLLESRNFLYGFISHSLSKKKQTKQKLKQKQKQTKKPSKSWYIPTVIYHKYK